MITTDEAQRIATEVIGPAEAADGQGWHLGIRRRLARPRGLDERESVRGGSFCVVERAAGRVLSFPSSVSPARIMTEYQQVVDRASRLSG